ncbi:MAG: hypothetical protein IJW00_05870 [Clostridia bacterium]|nr:hypothetical protein [Clostridia bacterium]
MKGSLAFEKLTGISDRYVEEAAAFSVPEKKVAGSSPWERFNRFINSGWGVAMICCLVAAGVMTGIIAAGHMAGPEGPPAHGTDTEVATAAPDTHPTFDFSYEMVDPKERYLYRETVGVTVTLVSKDPNVTLTMANLFDFTPKLVPHGESPDSENAIRGQFNYDEVKHPENNESHMKIYDAFFEIPKGVWEGDYDLYCYFGEEYQRFPWALKLASDTDPTFDFSFVPDRTPAVYAPGETATFSTVVINTGDPFDFSGYFAAEFGAVARLVLHGEDGSTAITEAPIPDDVFHATEVDTGMRVTRSANISIPEDAAEGYYDLYLSFGKEYRVFEKAVTVGTPPRFLFKYRFDDAYYGETNDTNTMESVPGGEFRVDTTVINNGDAFTYTGGRFDFRTSIEFIHSQNSAVTFTGDGRILDTYDEQHTVENGQEGWCEYMVTVPADAPEGRYHLRLSYGEVSCIIENALTVKKSAPSGEVLTSILWNGETVSLTYQRTVNEYGIRLLDQYLGSNGLTYLFYSGTSYLYSFDNDELQGGSPDKTDTITKAEGRVIADNVLKTFTAISDLSVYEVKEDNSASGSFSYWYTHYIGSIKSDYYVIVRINKHGDVVSFSSTGWAENLPYITEEDVRAAQKRLTGSDKAPYYALTVKDGVLCVYTEEIVAINPPIVETTEDGYEIGGGCGYDHEHVFTYEEITPAS